MKYLILGAGPAGLSFGNLLKNDGVTSFLVLEKEDIAGGLCRSEMVDEYPLDIGGGHFLDAGNERVNNFLFSYMPRTEWNLFERISLIYIYNMYISHPIEANVWQFPADIQKVYLESISQAGCNQGKEMPAKFVDWIFWKLGDKVAEDYMLPYNRKMFAEDLNSLGTYWLEKLPNVSFEETIRSCKEHKSYGKEPGHTQFYYPKKEGYGEVWKRMAENIDGHVIYQKNIDVMDLDKRYVVSSDGETYAADNIITTIPWKAFKLIKGMPVQTVNQIRRLKHSSIEVRYFVNDIKSNAHWIYYPDEYLPYHRCLLRKNFMPGGRGYWTETRKERVAPYEKRDGFRYMNEYAYPLNTLDKPQIMHALIHNAECKNVYPLGRWGEHMHYNSDVVVERAMELFERLEGKAVFYGD